MIHKPATHAHPRTKAKSKEHLLLSQTENVSEITPKGEMRPHKPALTHYDLFPQKTATTSTTTPTNGACQFAWVHAYLALPTCPAEDPQDNTPLDYLAVHRSAHRARAALLREDLLLACCLLLAQQYPCGNTQPTHSVASGRHKQPLNPRNRIWVPNVLAGGF